MNKMAYTKPEFEAVELTKQDILNGSDVLIDGSDLFAPAE